MSPATKLGLGALCALPAAILTIALWSASEADKALGDGEVDAALSDVADAAADTRADAAEQFTERVDDAEDALSRAADGFAGTVTADDGFDSTFETA